MQRITLDSEISYVVTEKELKEIRADERKKAIEKIRELKKHSGETPFCTKEYCPHHEDAYCFDCMDAILNYVEKEGETEWMRGALTVRKCVPQPAKAMDTIVCSNKEDAKTLIDRVGCEHIRDWTFLDDGSIKMWFDCSLKEAGMSDGQKRDN